MTHARATFSADWLSARERFDHAARDRAWPRLAELLRSRLTGISRIIDLGCGTGSNLRYLGPRLQAIANAAPLQALLVDADHALLAAAQRRFQSPPPGIEAVSYLHSGLLSDSDWPEVRSTDLVSASALVDLVSQAWLHGLIERCHAGGAAVLLALSYDGRSSWSPAHPLDQTIVTLFNADQQSDKGLGPALGPTAVAAAVAMLERKGYIIRQTRSDWLLDTRRGSARGVVDALITDHARIAARDHPGSAGSIEQWLLTRQRQLHTGRLRVRIGHQDIAALPAAKVL